MVSRHPSEKWWSSSIGMIIEIPNMNGKIKNWWQPNHQPDKVLLGKIGLGRNTVTTIYHHLPVVKGVISNPSINQPTNGKRTSIPLGAVQVLVETRGHCGDCQVSSRWGTSVSRSVETHGEITPPKKKDTGFTSKGIDLNGESIGYTHINQEC